MLLAVGLLLTGCTSEEPCPIGSETCACTTAGACNPGLTCLSGLCVSGSTTDAAVDSGSADSGPGGSDASPTDSGGTTDSGGAMSSWMKACEDESDCEGPEFCAATGVGAPTCTTACDSDSDCQNRYETPGATCGNNLCFPTCLGRGVVCPGDSVCHRGVVCIVDPIETCGNGRCDFFEHPSSCSDDCAGCGNDWIDDGEQCDGEEFGGWDCTDFGYSGGTLACDPVMCTFDAEGCV